MFYKGAALRRKSREIYRKALILNDFIVFISEKGKQFHPLEEKEKNRKRCHFIPFNTLLFNVVVEGEM